MKHYLLSTFLFITCSLLFVTELYAQCTANLINNGSVVTAYTKSDCSRAVNKCNQELSYLKSQNYHQYKNGYCTVGGNPPPPNKKIVRSYDRCQAPGVVRCTAHYSDGSIVEKDYPCSGCMGYSNPSGDPCGWKCPFPQVR